ncbi:MAG: undecaprenyl-phosphate glucose phosphotransferase [Betaproteobacteria bacterium]|nr:undecaprenyl-phosphate glucose phosphotransferase [Betaproteobacteria bacterium]
MFAALDQQQNLLKVRLSLTTLVGYLLDPILLVASLAAVMAHYGEPFSAPYLTLWAIVVLLAFPGKSQLGSSTAEMYRDLISGWLLLFSVLIFFGYVSGYLDAFPRYVLVTWFAAAPVTLLAGHHIMREVIPRLAVNNQRTAVVVGANEHGQKLAEQIRANPFLGVRVIGFFDDRVKVRAGDTHDNAILGPMNQLGQFVKARGVDIIYLALPMASQPRILQLLDDLRDTTSSIYFVPDIFMTDLIQARVDNVSGMPVVAVCETPFTGVNGLIKRASDIVLSILILILISPVMLAIAIGVKRSSPGPVLFKQRRYGLDGKEIIVYKFRSMSVCEDGFDMPQAQRNDPRVTAFGALIRRTSLDELPQFFNVLQGRMSIVGPRPHAVAHNETYRRLIKGYMIRHKVKPGITGWAQVNGCGQ